MLQIEIIWRTVSETNGHFDVDLYLVMSTELSMFYAVFLVLSLIDIQTEFANLSYLTQGFQFKVRFGLIVTPLQFLQL